MKFLREHYESLASSLFFSFFISLGLTGLMVRINGGFLRDFGGLIFAIIFVILFAPYVVLWVRRWFF